MKLFNIEVSVPVGASRERIQKYVEKTVRSLAEHAWWGHSANTKIRIRKIRSSRTFLSETLMVVKLHHYKVYGEFKRTNVVTDTALQLLRDRTVESYASETIRHHNTRHGRTRGENEAI